MYTHKLGLGGTFIISAFIGFSLFLAITAHAATVLHVDNTVTCDNATVDSSVTPFCTISAAVTAATAGDTIQVAAGTYNESVVIDKTLTLQGAQQGVDARTRSASESVINGTSPIAIMADNVVIDGFTIQGSDSSSFISGIWDNPSYSGTHGGFQILNNIIQNNVSGIGVGNDGTIQALVEYNLIKNNNTAGPGSGNGFSAAFETKNVVISYNTFDNNQLYVNGFESSGSTGVQNVTVSYNEVENVSSSGFFLMGASGMTLSDNDIHDNAGNGLSMAGAVDSTTISGSTFKNNTGYGVKVSDDYTVGANSNISVQTSDIEANTLGGLLVDVGTYTGTLDASQNWWGALSGPANATTNLSGTGNSVSDGVTFKPWYIDSGLTTLSNAAPTIDTFTILGDGTVDQGTKTVAVTVAYGTDVTALTPTFTFTGSSVSPNSGVVNNFSTPQIYPRILSTAR